MSLFGTILLICLCALLYFHSNDMHHRFDKLEEKLTKFDKQATAIDKKEPTEVRSAARAWDVRVATEKRAREKNERNREVKRRAKERKRSSDRQRLLDAVVESLEYEQKLRNAKAAERGWPIHPNDMDWLGEEQRKAVLDTWSERGLFRPEWQNPSA